MTGWDGLVGRELRRALAHRPGARVAGGDLPALDVRFAGTLRARVLAFHPDWVVHLAAWTEVDACESDPARARRVNGEAAGNAALAARAAGARLLHVSTDYVFDGNRRKPRGEDDPVRPLSVYGRTKLEGEGAVRARLPGGRWTIVRGQSLYGTGRKSFPDAILRAATMKKEIPVVTDQIVSPTWARDFAEALVVLLERGAAGVFHVSAAESCSWNEFAAAVLEEAGVEDVRVTPLTAAALGRPAERPEWSVFDLGKYRRRTGRALRPWRRQLRDYLRARPGAA